METLASNLDRVTAEHAFNLLLATAGLAFTYLLAWEIGHSRRAAALAMAEMAVMPAVIAHSRNNPKDVATLLIFPLTFLLLLRAVRKPGLLRMALAGIVLGISLNTRIFSVALIPLFALLLAIRWPALLRQRIGQLIVIGSVAAAIAILLWPWLWLEAPLDQLARVGELIATKLGVQFQVLYLDEMQLWTEIPWHFPLFHLLASLPLSLMLLAAVPILATLLGKLRRPESFDLVLAGALWIGVLLAWDLIAPARYDGMRHYLAVLVGLSLLVGAGGDWLLAWLEDRRPFGLDRLAANRLGWTLVGSLIALAGWECIQIHPYQSAYLNPVASALGGEQSDEWVEV
jgi:4-amino-4-deoxy-L-arabinose transferase-like glycosyltransferase